MEFWRLSRCAVLVLVLVSCCLPGITRSALPPQVRIGAMFNTGATMEKDALEFAIEQVNGDSEILPTTRLIAVSEEVTDAFSTSKKACSLMRTKSEVDNVTGIAAIFGVIDQSSMDLMDAISETFTLPLMQSTPDLSYTRHNEAEQLFENMKINLHPAVEVLSDALLDFMRAFQWNDAVILYKGNEGLVRVKSVLNAGFIQIGSKDKKLDIQLWEMDDMERTLKELRYNVPYKHIIVDISAEEIPKFLDVAARMGILTSYHHYMFTTLDLEAMDVGKYTLGGVNITGYRMIDTKGPMAQRVLTDWVMKSVRPREKASAMVLIRNALIIDAVHLFSRALESRFGDVDSFSTKAINCQAKTSDSKWSDGEHIYNTIQTIEMKGLTGKIKIDSNGKRTEFDMDLIEYDTDGKIQVVGHWTKTDGLNVTKSAERRQSEIRKDLNNKTLRVVVKAEEPFIIIKNFDAEGKPIPRGSKEQYSGYAIDMMAEIAKILNLSYVLYTVPDGSTGRELPNGSWTGMIGQLTNGNADLALGDLTINYERSSVIDFTKPFMNLGISILFKRPEPDPPKLFSFLEPLDNNIWMCMLGAYAFVSIFLFVIARFSPFEWKNPHPCNADSDVVENEFTLLNSFWFTIGSLMQQGCEIAPKASSTRLIAGVWWFFTLILISSYTANLAAFLTITRMSTPIKNADDLAKQTTIKYGCYFGGSTYSFFKNSKIPTYEKMWNFMKQHDDVFVNSSDLGIAKVKAGKYAYLMESIPLRYQLSKHCDLMEVGGELDSKGYGIGVPLGSPFRDSLSNAILSLSEQQILLNLYNKWWQVDNTACKNDDDPTSASSASQLGMANLGGVFVFLIGGLALALVIALLEFIINAFVNSRADKQSLCSEILEECRFAIKCWGPSEKPINQAKFNGASHGLDILENPEAQRLT